jgi:hypothetical protein
MLAQLQIDVAKNIVVDVVSAGTSINDKFTALRLYQYVRCSHEKNQEKFQGNRCSSQGWNLPNTSQDC